MLKASSERRYLSKSGLVILTMVLLAVLAVDYLRTSVWLEPQPGTLTDISNVKTLRAQFNRDAGMIRLVIFVVPT